MLCVCLVFMPIMLELLYSDKFLGAIHFIMWSCLGMMFKLSSWLVAFLFVAKADSKLFMINELLGNIYYLIFSIIGYTYWGVTGLGIGFVTYYVIYFIQVLVISTKRYSFKFSISFIKNYAFQLALVMFCLFVSLLICDWRRYLVGGSVAIVSLFFALKGLNNRINIFQILRNKIR